MTSSSSATTTHFKKDNNKSDHYSRMTAEDVYMKSSVQLEAAEKRGRDHLLKLYEGKANSEYEDHKAKNNGKELPVTPAQLPQGFGSLLYEQVYKRPDGFVPIRRGLIPPSHAQKCVRDSVHRHLLTEFRNDKNHEIRQLAGSSDTIDDITAHLMKVVLHFKRHVAKSYVEHLGNERVKMLNGDIGFDKYLPAPNKTKTGQLPTSVADLSKLCSKSLCVDECLLEVIHKTCYPEQNNDTKANGDLHFHNTFGLHPIATLRDEDESDIQTYNPGNGKVKQIHSVFALNLTMQTFRKKFQRVSTCANHGLKVTDSISKKAEVLQRRKDRDSTRKNGKFNVELQVSGWKSEQHIWHCKNNHLPIPGGEEVKVSISRIRKDKSTSNSVSDQH